MKQHLISALLLCTGLLCLGQRVKTVEEHLPTENLEMRKDANKRSNKPKSTNYDFIYVPNADKILYGNQCVLEITHKWGFEYVVEPRNIAGSKNWKGKFLNNLWVKTKLVVTRSPFWKQILRGKIKKCRKMSGDLVG
ncbi:hypothetical protein SAMN05421640_2145 [Ekhidna lutea]|uniref:Uncharacterized protein n=1 Tax=Ekhidna lutea TaxID=447679 RepID=A0A239JFI1_EKHLU|nr:hypothetical protein [Ekhidna lutea]SNT04569.1 hypothetical protein SAMN05421640_2145 [Ekhidna lutea]